MLRLHAEIFTPLGGLVVFSILLAALFLAGEIMARIEGRSIADYVYPNPAAIPDPPQRL